MQERGQGGICVPCSVSLPGAAGRVGRAPRPLPPQLSVSSEVSWPFGFELFELLLPVHSRECPQPAQETLFLMFSLEAEGASCVGCSV